MCRFVYYQGLPINLSALITEPENSLINQSFHANELTSPLNGDGFGLAWYPADDGRPALFKSVLPAWNNRNLREIARVVRSSRILGHVRAASPGSRACEENSHPFRYGNMTFMHNGELGGFSKFRRELLGSLSDEAFENIIGGTDSEHMFAVIVDEYAKLAGAPDDVTRLANALERAIGRLLRWRQTIVPEQIFYINCLLTDGRGAVACRFTTAKSGRAASLYYHMGKRYHCENCRSRLVNCNQKHTSVLVSSEHLTEDVGWTKVPVGQMVMIDKEQRVEMRPLRFGSEARKKAP